DGPRPGAATGGAQAHARRRRGGRRGGARQGSRQPGGTVPGCRDTRPGGGADRVPARESVTVEGTAALRIAMVAPPWYGLPPDGYGGIESVCATLVEQLVDHGHDVTVCGVGKGATAGRFVGLPAESQ